MLTLKHIFIKNFRSFKEEFFTFPETNGLKFLGGHNLVETRLGANGSGKSSLWEAVTWCLYGSGIRGTRSSNLLSWDTHNLAVMVALDVGGRHVECLRQSPPMKIEINEKTAEQKDIEEILKLSKSRFLNSVIFGQGIPLFPDLTIAERGELLDEVLDLNLWMKCSEAANFEQNAADSLINDRQKNQAFLTGQLSSLRSEDEFSREIEKYLTEIEGKTVIDITEVKKEYDHLIDLERDCRRQLDILRYEKDTTAKLLSFWKENDFCSSCGQKITEIIKTSQVNSLEDKQNELRGKISELADLHTEFDSKLRASHNLYSSAQANNTALKFGKKVIGDLLEEFENLEKKRNEITEKILLFSKEIQILEVRKTAGEYWNHAFKRIRLSLIRNVLASLSVEVNSALSSLGLEGWSITFVNESETKSGTIKLGVQIIVRSPNSTGVWEGWSGGESQRLRIAIAMGLASMIQRMAGIKYNMEVWDEPSAWLSAEGIEDLLVAFSHRAESQGRQVWVVDHRALTYSGFKEIWSVVKGENGSHIEKVSEEA